MHITMPSLLELPAETREVSHRPATWAGVLVRAAKAKNPFYIRLIGLSFTDVTFEVAGNVCVGNCNAT